MKFVDDDDDDDDDKNVGTSFFPFVTNHAFDGQTDGQHSHGYTVRCITCSRTLTKTHEENESRKRSCGE